MIYYYKINKTDDWFFLDSQIYIWSTKTIKLVNIPFKCCICFPENTYVLKAKYVILSFITFELIKII